MVTKQEDEEEEEGEKKAGRSRSVAWQDFSTERRIPSDPGPTKTDRLAAMQDQLDDMEVTDIADLKHEEMRAKAEEMAERAKLRAAEARFKRQQVESGRYVPANMGPETPRGTDNNGPLMQDGGMQLDSNDAELAKQIVDLEDPEKEQAFIRVYSAMAAAKNPNGMGMFMPALASYAQKPDTDANQITKVGEAMVNALKMGIEMNQKNQGDSKFTETLMLKLIDKWDKQPTQTAPDPMAFFKGFRDAGFAFSAKDMMDMRKDVMDMRKDDSGKYVMEHTGTSPADIEMERLRTESNLKLEEIRNTTQLELAKLGIENKRTEAITGLGSKLFTTAGRAMAQGEMDELDEGGRGMPSNAPVADVAEANCPNCSNKIVIPEPSKARKLKCVKCGMDVQWTPQ